MTGSQPPDPRDLQPRPIWLQVAGWRPHPGWRTQERRIDWFELADGDYRLLPADDAGVVRSRVFPGLWLACRTLLNGDLATALGELQKGIDSTEHRRFAARLAEPS